MRKKAIRYIVANLAVAVCFSAFALTAFAEQDSGGTNEEGASFSSSAASSQPGDPSPAPEGGSSVAVGHESDDDKILVTFNLNGGSGMHTSAKVSKGTTVSEFKQPTRKGYEFAGWLLDGNQVSGSKALSGPVTLTAAWTRTASSDAASVDTRQSEIEAAASAAEENGSDGGTLSSEDWNALLGASSGAALAAVSSASPASSEAQRAGGFSSLFLAGVILVVLGTAGVGTFIYLQFIRGRHGPRGRGGSDGATDDTIVFTDVSSCSGGKKRSGELYGAVRQTVPGQPETPAEQAGDKKSPPTAVPEKARATPAEDAKSDFDWEKFFNEDGRGKK